MLTIVQDGQFPSTIHPILIKYVTDEDISASDFIVSQSSSSSESDWLIKLMNIKPSDDNLFNVDGCPLESITNLPLVHSFLPVGGTEFIEFSPEFADAIGHANKLECWRDLFVKEVFINRIVTALLSIKEGFRSNEVVNFSLDLSSAIICEHFCLRCKLFLHLLDNISFAEYTEGTAEDFLNSSIKELFSSLSDSNEYDLEPEQLLIWITGKSQIPCDPRITIHYISIDMMCQTHTCFNRLDVSTTRYISEFNGVRSFRKIQFLNDLCYAVNQNGFQFA
jgi:hypothetical protein